MLVVAGLHEMHASSCTNLFLGLLYSDDTVEVGGDLYEIDTEAEATVEASTDNTSATAEATTAAKPAEQITVQSASLVTEASPHAARTPSIKFLGKDGWEALLKGETKTTTSTTSSTRQSPNAVTTIVDNTSIHPMYGRPRFTEEEMEALILGGANFAPTVLAHSSGAKFKYQ